MKTPLQQHIAYLKRYRRGLSMGQTKKVIDDAIKNCEKLLPIEEDNLKQAFVDGDERGANDIPFNCDQYFTQKYK